MSTDFTGWVRIRTYLQMPLGIPMLFRKYDAPQAMRMSINVLKHCVRELLGPRALRWIRRLLLTAWYLTGPVLLILGARHVWRAPSVSYVLLWEAFSLAVIGLTLSMHALGRLTLRWNARAVFKPLATIPVRLVLLTILWLPVVLGLTFEGSLLFGGTTLAAYLLLAPHFAQWLQLGLLQWGSPRRASLTHAMSLPMIDEHSLERFCAHEAGHALMYGLGEEIPEDLYLYIDRELIGDGVGGAVLAAEEFTPEQTTLEALRFRLVLLAAGAAGEKVRLGNMSISAHFDFVGFETIAPYYLLSAGYPVIAQPTSVEQHEVNATAIARLRADMIEVATRVIEANRDVHDELIQMLAVRNELAYDDVLPVLSKVRPVPGAPRPTWSKTTVTHRLLPRFVAAANSSSS